jgi:hypothetical protein
MAWLIRSLRIPANETKMGVVLALCAMTMSILSLAVAWQAQIISQQHEAIQWLAKVKFGFSLHHRSLLRSRSGWR